MFIVLGMGLYAENDYYYNLQRTKVYVELLPTKKYVMVRSPEDTLYLINKLAEQQIKVYPFQKSLVGFFLNYDGSEDIRWTTIEGESLPDLTTEEVVLYEAPYFTKNYWNGEIEELGVSELFQLKLYKAEDFAILENMAKENGVTILGRETGKSLYFLSCSKESEGNAMQMANLFYESLLFDFAVPLLISNQSDALQPTKIDSPSSNSIVLISGSDASNSVVIEAKNDRIDYLEVFDLTGKLLFASAYPDATTVHWDRANNKGICLFKIQLKSGQVVNKKN
jgi:hypothetical protein